MGTKHMFHGGVRHSRDHHPHEERVVLLRLLLLASWVHVLDLLAVRGGGGGSTVPRMLSTPPPLPTSPTLCLVGPRSSWILVVTI